MIGFIFSCFFSSNLNTQGSLTETSSPALLSYVFCCLESLESFIHVMPSYPWTVTKRTKKILQICIIFGWRISMYNQIKETYDHQVVLACSFPFNMNSFITTDNSFIFWSFDICKYIWGGVELLWGKCVVFPDLGTGDTDRWR